MLDEPQLLLQLDSAGRTLDASQEEHIMTCSSDSQFLWVLQTQGTAILAAAQVLCSKRGAFKEVYVDLTVWWCGHACNLRTRRLEEEDCTFQANLSYLTRFLLQRSKCVWGKALNESLKGETVSGRQRRPF